MGQKTHPVGFRLGIIKGWNSRWYAPQRNFADLVFEDMMIKRYINKRLDNAGISAVIISRAAKKVTVDIHTSRPGIVIGRRGAEVDKLREELQMLTKKDILLNIVEVRKPELNAKLVADSVARQLEGRVSFRRAMKKALAATMKMGAEGIKIQCGGRLGGAEIARTEKYKDGRTPLHTLRADIDYALATANTTYGCIGVKVWICKGEILEAGQFIQDSSDAPKNEQQQAPRDMDQGGGRPRRDDRPSGGGRPGGGSGKPQQGGGRGDGRGPGGGRGRGGDNRGGGGSAERPRGRVRRPGDSDANAPRGRRPEGESGGSSTPTNPATPKKDV
ncbi:MAG: 30S ribosomal protein S3 [candidate division Zixibacteria bacterium]|nr:30S ribosomal protein S3 [candidate division Zixibacteria bacterium]